MVDFTRRRLLGGMAATGTALAGGTALAAPDLADTLDHLLQSHFLRMTPEELTAALARIERQAQREHGTAIRCTATPAVPGVVFGFALNLSRCEGSRRCVTACVRENNGGRNDTLNNIRVFSLPRGSWELAQADPYYAPAVTPEPGRWYLPVQCQQCEQPACVRNCPVEATWKEPDGIVVIDYDWCIGCRACAVACPYGARHFNWQTPVLPAAGITPDTHYLGNRPRPAGVMEKCTHCIQRTRAGRLPACQEACETGARVFGNLADPESDIRRILATHPVYRLKEEKGTHPTFFYYLESA